eukprot:COSAG06_NODE_44809_length_360_cov_0.789272_2_plen_26_part_01
MLTKSWTTIATGKNDQVHNESKVQMK